MKPIQPIVQMFLAVIIVLPLGLFNFISGWLCLHSGKGVLTPPQYIGILILRILKGKEVAIYRKKELIDQQKSEITGYAEIATGVFALVYSLILFVEAIQRF